MKQYNKYIQKWQKVAIKLNEAMQKDNFEACDELMKESANLYEQYKKCCSYPESNRQKTFGELNYMLECELPRLFKDNKKALRECTNYIKKDKNLLSEFRFIDALRNYNDGGDSHSYVTESLELASNEINRKTMRESLNGFADLLSKHEIGGYTLDEEAIAYYRACDKVLTESKRLQNLMEFTKNVNTIADYIDNHKTPVVESKESNKTMMETLEKKIANLNEEERELVRGVIDGSDVKQENVFNKFKNECLNLINKLREATDNANEIEDFNNIQETIENKMYCRETVVQDLSQLLEIRDVFVEK